MKPESRRKLLRSMNDGDGIPFINVYGGGGGCESCGYGGEPDMDCADCDNSMYEHSYSSTVNLEYAMSKKNHRAGCSVPLILAEIVSMLESE